MTDHPVETAFPNGGSSTALTIQQQLAAAFPLVLEDADDIEAMDLTGLDVVEVRANGAAFIYDAANVDPHNGVTVLVSDDGKHFVAPLAPQSFTNVIERTNTPPGSPAAGDRYIVGPAPSGAWASNADDLTYHDGAQWVFVSPVVGQEVYVRDSATRGHWRWDETGAWLDNSALTDGAVTPGKMRWPWGAAVEEETATPPGGMPTAGTLYIVGVSATGAWSGQDTDIAEADGAGGWTFHTPYEGSSVYDTDLQIKRLFRSGEWQAEQSGYAEVTDDFDQDADAITMTIGAATAGYTFSASTGPTQTTNGRFIETLDLDVQAEYAGQVVDIEYHATVTALSHTTSAASVTEYSMVAALFVDSESASYDHCRVFRFGQASAALDTDKLKELSNIDLVFKLTLADTSLHTLKIVFFPAVVGTTFLTGSLTTARRRFIAKKRS